MVGESLKTIFQKVNGEKIGIVWLSADAVTDENFQVSLSEMASFSSLMPVCPAAETN